jgi:hypothetical protein
VRPRPSRLGIGLQAMDIRKHWPEFKYFRHQNAPTWTGPLQPYDSSPTYVIRVEYRPPVAPTIQVLRPVIHSNAPHRFSDGSLCLYWPKDSDKRIWTPDKRIAATILPWAAEWLAVYEVWLSTGEWVAPEAPHHSLKRR